LLFISTGLSLPSVPSKFHTLNTGKKRENFPHFTLYSFGFIIMSEVDVLEQSLIENKTVFIRGISKRASPEQVSSHLGTFGLLLEEWRYHPTNRGIVYATYKDEESSQNAIKRLHQSELLGVTISVRPLNYNKNISTNRSIVERDAIITRNILKNNQNKGVVSVSYANHGVCVNGDMYPIPQGRYLLQLFKLSMSCDDHVKGLLAQLLFSSSNNNDNNKEIRYSLT
jgi:RNA recognition motif-containing protein